MIEIDRRSVMAAATVTAATILLPVGLRLGPSGALVVIPSIRYDEIPKHVMKRGPDGKIVLSHIEPGSGPRAAELHRAAVANVPHVR